MSSWVYLFSQFTPEALILEGLVILSLLCGYIAFWILKKRRYGTVDESVPSIPVRDYLDEFISESEQLRQQLFGILYSQAADANRDPLLSSKLKQLEAKLTEKEQTLETLSAEKNQITGTLEKTESQLKELKARLEAGDSAEAKSKYEEQIRALEEKLTEYSIIEDDLANLKRFQSENAKLKALLKEKGISVPSAGGANSATTAPAPEPEPTATPAAAAATQEPVLRLVPQAESAEAEPIDVSKEKDPELNSVEALLESSLNSGPAPEVSSPPAASAPDPKTDASQNKEDDLVKEFEKMLKE